MVSAKQGLTADQALDRAFEMFERFVKRDRVLRNVLLEELERVEEGWVVAIGFDGNRQESSEPSGNASWLGGQKKTVTVREIRHFYLDQNGDFIRMN